MENKEVKIADVVERLTAEQYVVMQLQRAENTINRNKAYMNNIERDNNLLTKNNEILNQIVMFIFRNFKFEFVGDNLFVNYNNVEVLDTELKQLIERAIKSTKAIKEEE